MPQVPLNFFIVDWTACCGFNPFLSSNAIRCAMIAKDRGESGSVDSASAYFMKSPNIQYTDEEARQMVEDFANNKNQSKSNKSRLDQ